VAATPYDFSNSYDAPKRRFSLARLRAASIGGGFGLLVVALGLLAIGLGWNGMAGGGGQVNGTSDLRAQLPWLVSGGILGLALVVFGAAMLIVHNARTDRARLEAKLDEVVASMARTTTPSFTGSSLSTAPIAAGSATDVVVAGPSAFHRTDCRLVQGRDDADLITTNDAKSRSLKPCRVCKP